MAKNREEVAQLVNDNIYNNSNKEITAAMVREVFEEYKESFFNLVDDRLKNLWYNNNSTLEDIIGNLNQPPLWGSTGYFNIGSNSGGNNQDIPAYSNPGIVEEAYIQTIPSSDAKIRITFNQSIDINTYRILVQVNTNNSYDDTMNASNDIGAPVLFVASSEEIYVAIKELSGTNQTIRLEIFAFKVNNGQ